MIKHSEIDPKELRKLIRKEKVRWAGNLKLKIYGTLKCKPGKRMKRENRVFFAHEKEAVAAGFRACKKCCIGPGSLSG